MGEKKKRVYAALIEGALQGLVGEKLRAFVLEKCPETSSKKLVRASLLALSDPDIMNAEILHAIYDLAIKYRLDPTPDREEDDEKTIPAPNIVPTSTRRDVKSKRKTVSAS